MKPSELFCFKVTKHFAALLFFLAAFNNGMNTGLTNTHTACVFSDLYHVLAWKQGILCPALRHCYLTLYTLCYINSRVFLPLEQSILGDPGAVSRVGRKGGMKVFKYGRKSPWVPTLTGLFPKIQADAGSWLAQKMLCIIVPNRRTVSLKFFSWVRTRRLLFRSRLVWLMHQR